MKTEDLFMESTVYKIYGDMRGSETLLLASNMREAIDTIANWPPPSMAQIRSIELVGRCTFSDELKRLAKEMMDKAAAADTKDPHKIASLLASLHHSDALYIAAKLISRTVPPSESGSIPNHALEDLISAARKFMDEQRGGA